MSEQSELTPVLHTYVSYFQSYIVLDTTRVYIANRLLSIIAIPEAILVEHYAYILLTIYNLHYSYTIL